MKDSMREGLKCKKRMVIKIGSSSLTHPESGDLNLLKIERLVRIISDLKGMGKEVVLVSSGAIAVGRRALHHPEKPDSLAEKQAFAAVGQARLMMVYQKLFAEYNQISAQVLMTKDTMINDLSRYNAKNTFEELLHMGVIPIVNENDTVSTYEIEFGDNDRLSAIVSGLIQADLLILLSDIDGLFTDDPNKNSDSSVGTGGMAAKIVAARIATDSGADMVVANGADMDIIYRILKGEKIGTLFLAHKNKDFDLMDYLAK